jgi:2-oxoglutarate ferredoxin oxidoreductase subunit alpha
MTIEINYSDDMSDPVIDNDNRRYSQLAWVLRAETLVDIDCYSNVEGQPLSPRKIVRKLQQELEHLKA